MERVKEIKKMRFNFIDKRNPINALYSNSKPYMHAIKYADDFTSIYLHTQYINTMWNWEALGENQNEKIQMLNKLMLIQCAYSVY